MRRQACKSWPFLVPALKYLVGILMILFRRYLKAATECIPLVSSNRSFKALMVDGKNELKKRLVRARRLEYRCEFSELHSMRRQACKSWPFLVPALKYLSGNFMFLFRRYLIVTECAPLVSSNRSFQALMVDGKNELKEMLVRARRAWRQVWI